MFQRSLCDLHLIRLAMLDTFPSRGRLWSCCAFKKTKIPFGTIYGILFSRGKLTLGGATIGRPKMNDYRKANNQHVILSGVRST